jgi:hypothetical protein
MTTHEQQFFRIVIDQDFASQTECHPIATFDLSLQSPLPLTQWNDGHKNPDPITLREFSNNNRQTHANSGQ